MEALGDPLDLLFFGNPVRVWLLALLVGLLAIVVLGFARSLLIRQVRRLSKQTHTGVDDVLSEVLRVTQLWFMAIVGLWAASTVPVLPPRIRGIIISIAVLAVLLQFGIWGTTAIKTYVRLYGERNLDEDAASVMTIRALGFLGSIGLWAVVTLVMLENLGFDVNALIAGLGIGGIAVALAVQNILGDLFASLSIVLDKPFVVGDFVVVDTFSGTVEQVGLKTTRLRSLSGEQLVFANSDLLTSRIRNYKRMFERRAVFTFGVEYSTPQEQLEWIPGGVRAIVEAFPDVRFDRAHFKNFGDSALNFEVVYYLNISDFNIYMDRQQAINLEINRQFAERGIGFAFPTRTVYVAKGAGAGAEAG